MCVEIFKSEGKSHYQPELSFEEQLKDSKEVLIDCSPNCPRVERFLNEVEKICKNGQSLPITIRLADNSNFKLFSKTKELNRDLFLNDIIGQAALIHKNADTKLKELSEICSKGSCGG